MFRANLVSLADRADRVDRVAGQPGGGCLGGAYWSILKNDQKRIKKNN